MGSYCSLFFHLISHGHLSVSAHMHPHPPSKVSLVGHIIDIHVSLVPVALGLLSQELFFPFQGQETHGEQILVP